MSRQLLETEQKALEINLDNSIYGTFSEIGAGQEVARYFFKVGASSGTIAKTMSAYDKTYSDCIYGLEPSKRYVCESRLYRMLDHEYDLMQERLSATRPGVNFFTFADTVSAINFSKTIKGSGWMGVRFQLTPNGAPNDIVLHVRLHDNDNNLQQQAVGILGVNLIYGGFRYHESPELLVQSLLDNLEGRASVDMLRMTGPNFEKIDNRLLSMMLVKNRLSEVAMFDKTGKNVHPSEFLYKQNVLIVRGAFRPMTKVNLSMLETAHQQFIKEPNVEAEKTHTFAEILLKNLYIDGEIDEQDFLDRAEVLSAMGQTVVISTCEDYSGLINYLNEYRIQKLGIVIGARPLLDVINERFYKNQDGQLLAAFGKLFRRNIQFFVYPGLQEGSEELLNSKNLPIPDGIKFLYKHLLDNKQITDIEGVDPEVLHIYSVEILKMLRADESGWENGVPLQVANMIKEKCLFGFPCERMDFEY